MDQNTSAKDKLEGFINKLRFLGYEIELYSNKPQIYKIDGELVNVRSRGKYKQPTDTSRIFWYSVAFSVLQEVKWVIYLTTEPDYFVMLPSSLLKNLIGYMYSDFHKSDVGIFDIDWDNLDIVLKQGKREPIGSFYHNLVHKEDYPRF